jgi:hypothetical protein
MKKQQLFILIFGIAIAFACKKQHRYPEDPKSTFDSPKTRLSGNWKLDDFTLNGTSIVNDLNNIANAPINIRDVTLNYFFNSDTKMINTGLLEYIILALAIILTTFQLL